MTSYREKGKKALGIVLKQEQNIRVIERNIFNKVYKKPTAEKEYISVIYQTINDISNGKELKTILSEIKTDKVGWEHEIFKGVKSRLEEQDNFIENPFEVAEGVFECHKILKSGKKCGSKRVFSYTKQVRSADEPESIFATCCACGAKWTYSG